MRSLTVIVTIKAYYSTLYVIYTRRSKFNNTAVNTINILFKSVRFYLFYEDKPKSLSERTLQNKLISNDLTMFSFI